MDKGSLNEILSQHKLWLETRFTNDVKGRSADLQYADLRYAGLRDADLRDADLRCADLRCADLQGADLQRADLQYADLQYTDLRDANLRDADLQYADLRCADLRCADLDFSCLPLWCGSLSAHFDDRQLKQVAYHLVKAGLQSKNASEKTKSELKKLVDFANGFRRAGECGRIEVE